MLLSRATGLMGRLRQPASVSIMDQVVTSAASLLFSIFIINTSSFEVFGQFSLATAMWLSCLSLLNATINTPMSVLVNGSNGDGRIEQSIYDSSALYISLFLSAIFAIILHYSIESNNNLLILVSFLFYFTNFTREYLRYHSFSMLKSQISFYMNLAYVIVISSCACLIYFYVSDETTYVYLASISFGNIASILVYFIALRRPIVLLPFRKTFKGYQPVWEYSMWSLVGVVVTELQSRSYVYLVSAFFGSTALGIVQAGRLLFQPLPLLVSAWGRVARVQFAKWNDLGLRKRILPSLIRWTVILCAMLLGIVILLAVLWPLLRQIFFPGDVPAAEAVVVSWAIVSTLMTLRGIASIALQSLHKFKEISLIMSVSAVSSLGAIAAILAAGLTYQFSIGTLAVGEIAALALMVYLLSIAFASNEVTKKTEE